MPPLLTSKIKTPFKDTHREKAPSNKTPALTKSTNTSIWIVGTSNQLFIRVFKLKQNCRYWQNFVLCDKSILYSPFYLS